MHNNDRIFRNVSTIFKVQNDFIYQPRMTITIVIIIILMMIFLTMMSKRTMAFVRNREYNPPLSCISTTNRNRYSFCTRINNIDYDFIRMKTSVTKSSIHLESRTNQEFTNNVLDRSSGKRKRRYHDEMKNSNMNTTGTCNSTRSAFSNSRNRLSGYGLSEMNNEPITDLYTLQKLVTKHATTISKYVQQKPLATHTRDAFYEIHNQIKIHYIQQKIQNSDVQQKEKYFTDLNDNFVTNDNSSTSIQEIPIILDSGCGTGRSSRLLGQMYPNHIIVGIDRSLHRLRKKSSSDCNNNNNNDNSNYAKNDDRTNDVMDNHKDNNDVDYSDGYENDEQYNGESVNPFDNNNNINNQPFGLENNTTTTTTTTTIINEDGSLFVQQISTNVWLVRADLIDFWRCILYHNNQMNVNNFVCNENHQPQKQNDKQQHNPTQLDTKYWHEEDDDNDHYVWSIEHHYLLYPNPYPKKSRLLHRWYAHPSFPILMLFLMQQQQQSWNHSSTRTSTGNHCNSKRNTLVIRSNWQQYLIEFQYANTILNEWVTIKSRNYSNNNNITHMDVRHKNANTNNDDDDDDNEFRNTNPNKNDLFDSCFTTTTTTTFCFEPVTKEPKRIYFFPMDNTNHHGDNIKQQNNNIYWTNFEEKYVKAGEPIYEQVFVLQEIEKK